MNGIIKHCLLYTIAYMALSVMKPQWETVQIHDGLCFEFPPGILLHALQSTYNSAALLLTLLTSS